MKKISFLFILLHMFSYGQNQTENLFDELLLDEEASSYEDLTNTKSYNHNLPKDEKYFSLSFINQTIAKTYYFALFPQFNVNLDNFAVSLGYPLRFGIYDFYDAKAYDSDRKKGLVNFTNFIIPRTNDFRTLFDIQRIIRSVRISNDSSPYFLEFNRDKTINLPYGILVKEMLPNWFSDQDYLFASGHAKWQYLELTGFIGPFFKMQMLGLSLASKPLIGIDNLKILQNLDLNISYAADYKSPNYTKKITLSNQKEYFELDNEKRLVKRKKNTAQAVAMTLSSDFAVNNWLTINPYASFAQLFLTGIKNNSMTYGAGFHAGSNYNFYVWSQKPFSTITLGVESRLFTQYYWPSYFDTTYMLDRHSLNQLASYGDNENNTKSLYLSTIKFDLIRLGYMFFLSYNFDDVLYTKISYENAYNGFSNFIPQMRKFNYLISAKISDRVSLFFRYEAYNIIQFNKLFDFNKNRELLLSKCQVKILPYFYADIFAQHKFAIKDGYTYSQDKDYIKGVHYVSNEGETKNFDFGMGLEFTMKF